MTAKKPKPAAKPAKLPRGRPSVMTSEKEAEILAILTMGGSRNIAADYVGIGRGTLHECIERDRSFSERIKKAESECQRLHLERLHLAEPWQASAWMLERKWPDEFGRRDRVDHTSSDGSMTPKSALDVSKLSDSALAEILAAKNESE